MPPTFTKRPVSPITCESAPVNPTDVLYPASPSASSDDERDQNSFPNARRKRIEALAKDFLEGRGLFIQTAALKGPFEGGSWKNPWARGRRSEERVRKRRRVDEEEGGVMEIMESAVKRREGGKRWRGDDEGGDVRSIGGRGSTSSRATASVGGRDAISEPRAAGRRGLGQDVKEEDELFIRQGGEEDERDEGRRVRGYNNHHFQVDHEKKESFLQQNPPQASRKTLEPYISTTMTDQAASSKFASKLPNRSPRPSPQASLPKRQTHYSRKTSASMSDRSNALFVDAPEELVKKESTHSRRSTSSSSGSSAFADALAAAQCNTKNNNSNPSLSSPTNKFKSEGKRLSFTASGQPILKPASLRTESVYIDPALLSRGSPQEKRGNPPALLSKRSSKSSGNPPTRISKSSSSKLSREPSTGGDQSREILPEAQIVPGEGVAPTALSGPSTNLLETEKQSLPGLPVMESEESFFRLSAAQKAQKSFRNELTTVSNEVKIKDTRNRPSIATVENATNVGVPSPANHSPQTTHTPVSAIKPPPTPTTTTPTITTTTTATTRQTPLPPLKKHPSFAPSPTIPFFHHHHHPNPEQNSPQTHKPHYHDPDQPPDPSSLPSPLSPTTPAQPYTRHPSMSTSPSPPNNNDNPPSPTSARTTFSALPTLSTSFLDTAALHDGQLQSLLLHRSSTSSAAVAAAATFGGGMRSSAVAAVPVSSSFSVKRNGGGEGEGNEEWIDNDDDDDDDGDNDSHGDGRGRAPLVDLSGFRSSSPFRGIGLVVGRGGKGNDHGDGGAGGEMHEQVDVDEAVEDARRFLGEEY